MSDPGRPVRDSSTQDLLPAFREAVAAAAAPSPKGTTADPQVAAAAVIRTGEQLLARWQELHRHYHTVAHLAEVLQVVGEYAGQATDAAAVTLAAWFHDAVYDPRRVDNEEASALLAESVLPGLDVPPARVAEVARLIRLTATHDPMPGDRNGGLLTDADLAILAAPPAVYVAYTRAIRAEYAYVPDAAFAAGRAQVLHNLLELTWLFHNPVLRERWEEVARGNLSAELATLRRDLAPPATAL